MSSAALNFNTPTGPLDPNTPGLVAWFTLDGDPDDAKVNYGANMSPAFGPGRARFEFPVCVVPGAPTASGNIYVLPPAGWKVKSAPSRAYVGQPEWGTVELEPSAANFPDRAVDRAELPPQEAGDEYGQVYGTLPPEFLALKGAEPITADIDLIRGDAFAYVTDWTAESVNPICTTAWLESIGQNTNFSNTMWYTPLLPLYPLDVQQAFLEDYSRFYTHLMIQGSLDLALVRATCLAARDAGLYAFVFDWKAQTFADLSDCIDGSIIGLEVDKIGSAAIAAGELDDTIAATCSTCVPKGIRVWLHFTASGGPQHVQHWAFPVPGTSYTDWWAQNQRLGVAGFLHQAWENTAEEDSAGKMGAMMFYARQGLAAASSQNPTLPVLLVSACEIMSVRPFYGIVDGPYAWRRSTEMVCCPTNGTPFMPGVAGSWNGPRRGMGPTSVQVL